MNERIWIHAMKKKSLVPLRYLFPFPDFKWWTTETRSFFTNSTKSFLWSWKEMQGHKFMNLVHFPCSFMLHQFWFPFLVLSIQTISIWWNDVAVILHNTSSKTKWTHFLVTSWSAHTKDTTLVFQAVGSGQYPVPHRKAKTMKAIVIMQLGTHKQCRATEKQT